ncbi:MAG: L,D-transpeptidase [Candidatus Caenarcaniphilales bacterium]|nr:L,D-transpeptidase [Candidatus Caenarcaniphilales bacterium]
MVCFNKKPFSLAIFSIVLFLFSGSLVAYAEPYIEINIPSRQLFFKDKQEILKKYTIAVGRSREMMTPIGDYKILSKEFNPGWIHPETNKKVLPGKNNPLGTRLIVFHRVGDIALGIHGTNEPSSIGKFVSHGFIRLNNKDIEELYNLVQAGTEVKIRYERLSWLMQDNALYLTIQPDPYESRSLTKDLVIALTKLKYKDATLNPDSIEKLLVNSSSASASFKAVNGLIGYMHK